MFKLQLSLVAASLFCAFFLSQGEASSTGAEWLEDDAIWLNGTDDEPEWRLYSSGTVVFSSGDSGSTIVGFKPTQWSPVQELYVYDNTNRAEPRTLTFRIIGKGRVEALSCSARIDIWAGTEATIVINGDGTNCLVAVHAFSPGEPGPQLVVEGSGQTVTWSGSRTPILSNLPSLTFSGKFVGRSVFDDISRLILETNGDNTIHQPPCRTSSEPCASIWHDPYPTHQLNLVMFPDFAGDSAWFGCSAGTELRKVNITESGHLGRLFIDRTAVRNELGVTLVSLAGDSQFADLMIEVSRGAVITDTAYDSITLHAVSVDDSFELFDVQFFFPTLPLYLPPVEIEIDDQSNITDLSLGVTRLAAGAVTVRVKANRQLNSLHIYSAPQAYTGYKDTSITVDLHGITAQDKEPPVRSILFDRSLSRPSDIFVSDSPHTCSKKLVVAVEGAGAAPAMQISRRLFSSLRVSTQPTSTSFPSCCLQRAHRSAVCRARVGEVMECSSLQLMQLLS